MWFRKKIKHPDDLGDYVDKTYVPAWQIKRNQEIDDLMERHKLSREQAIEEHYQRQKEYAEWHKKRDKAVAVAEQKRRAKKRKKELENEIWALEEGKRKSDYFKKLLDKKKKAYLKLKDGN